jgi:tetratricopeptide (TPR) repeat protein
VCTGIDGDHALQQGLYEHAILAYSKEITENPSALVYHYKRSMAYLLANKHQLAINDLEHVISNDKTFHKAYTQRAKILVKLGRCAEAKRDLAHVVEHSGEARELENSASRCVQLDAVVREFYRNKDWGNLLNSVQELGDIATNYKEVLEMEMEALLETRDYERLIASSGKLLMFDKNNIHAYLQRGRAYYLTGNDDMALK